MTCEVVAELSGNHNGDLRCALELIRACSYAGVDAVKFQCWSPGKMVLDSSAAITHSPWGGWNLAELYEKAHTPWGWFPDLIEHARRFGMPWFASVYDHESLEFLELLNCPRYKIASFELVDIPLIEACAKTGKPLILSTGMGTAEEIGAALDTARSHGAADVTLLKCTSAYPADAGDVNLLMICEMRERWGARVGLSDHTQGIGVAIVAASPLIAADMIEKHVKLSHGYCLDDAFSLTPSELAQLVVGVEQASSCIGRVTYGATEKEQTNRGLRRSLYFAVDLPADTVLGREHLRTARPALGVPPGQLPNIVGKRLRRDVNAGKAVQWEDLEWLSQR